MRQFLIIPVICYLTILVEFALFNLFGPWGDPHLSLLVVIFFNLYSGIRYSLWAALWAGVFHDCFTTLPFGANVFAYVACAYASTFIRKYAYERGSDLSKWWMVACVVTLHTFLMGMMQVMIFEEVRWAEVWTSIWAPEVLITLVVTIFVFEQLRNAARVLKF